MHNIRVILLSDGDTKPEVLQLDEVINMTNIYNYLIF